MFATIALLISDKDSSENKAPLPVPSHRQKPKHSKRDIKLLAVEDCEIIRIVLIKQLQVLAYAAVAGVVENG